MKDNFPYLYKKIRDHRRESLNADLMAGHELFESVISGERISIAVYADYCGYGWWAIDRDRDGFSIGPFCAHSFKSREDALLQLVENIEEQILTNQI